MRHDVWKVAYAPDGKTVATVTVDGAIRIGDVATTKLLREERVTDERHSSEIEFSPDAASRLLAIAWERAIHLWDVAHSATSRRSRSTEIVIRTASRSRPMERRWQREYRQLKMATSGSGESATAHYSGGSRARRTGM